MPLSRASMSFGSVAALAGLGASFAYTEFRARHAERHHPPVGRFLEVDGVRLHYVDEGQGSPLVLLHGEGSLLQDFTLSIMPDFAKRYRVFAFDRPGYGYSSRPQDRVWTAGREARLLRHALERLGIEHPVLVGHSWGALLAMGYAALYPGTVSGAVLISGFFYPVGWSGAWLLGLGGKPVVGPLLSRTVARPMVEMAMPGTVRMMFSPSEVPPHFQHFPFGLKTQPTALRTQLQEAGLLHRSAGEFAPSYPALTIPLTILAGDGDKIVGWRRHSLRLHREVPSSTFRLFENTGHMLHHIRPDEVIAAVEWTVDQAVGFRSNR